MVTTRFRYAAPVVDVTPEAFTTGTIGVACLETCRAQDKADVTVFTRVVVLASIVMPGRLVADRVIVFTVEPAVCCIATLWHIPWALVFVVAEWVAVTDVVWTRLAVLVDAILGTDPVTHIGIIVTAALRCILLTGTGFRCTEETAHRVVALLIAIWAVRWNGTRFVF